MDMRREGTTRKVEKPKQGLDRRTIDIRRIFQNVDGASVLVNDE
jgi:hypothetical protein